jgi:Spy/CpxP family protein refolding chaperone
MALLLTSLVLGAAATAAPPEGKGEAKSDRKAQRAEQKEQKRSDKAAATQPGDETKVDRRKNMRQRMFNQLFDGIELTEDQKTEIHAIFEAGREEHQAWRTEHKDEFKEIRDQMREAHKARDEEKIEAAKERLRTLIESAPKPAQVMDEVRTVLTEEQQVKFDENREALLERMREHRRPFGPDGPPPHARDGRDGRGGPPEHARTRPAPPDDEQDDE